MTYALIENDLIVEYPVYEGDIRLLYPNVSFSSPFTPPEGYVPVTDVPLPEFDHTENCEEGHPVLVGDEWTRNWIVTPASAEQVEERVNARWFTVRADRNRRLAQSDWTQLADSPVNAADWTEYRQALRDITTQADPFNIVWPEQP